MEDIEFEEGEAFYSKNDSNVDPDIALSYIDEKLQNVLGHFIKDFEGEVTEENLGAKYGGYGSFLPTYQRTPSVRPQSKAPQRVQNFSSTISPYVLPVEGCPYNSTTPSDAARSMSIVTASCGLSSLHNARALPGYVSANQDSWVCSAQVNEKFPVKLEPVSNKAAKQDSCLSSVQVIEKFPLKHEHVLNRPANPSEHRTLKFRIKMGSDNSVRKNAAIYSGLGLISPSSSMGNSPSSKESDGMPPECQVTLEKSPSSILRIMTSSPVPDGLLLSPLSESFFCLERKEKNSQNSKLVPAIKSGEELSAVLAKDLPSSMGNKKVPKETKMKIPDKSHTKAVLKLEVGEFFGDKRSTLAEQEARRSVEADKDVVESRSPGGLVKKKIMEDKKGGEYKKAEARKRSVEKIYENRLKNSLVDISADHGGNANSRNNKVSIPSKADSDVSASKREPNIGVMGKSRQKVAQTSTHYEEDGARLLHGVGKCSFEGKKKSRGRKSSDRQGSEVERSLMAEVHEMPKDKKKAVKLHKSKLQNDIRKASDKDVLPEKRIEQMNKQIDSPERPFVDREKDSNLAAVQKKNYASVEKPKVASICKKVDKLTSETILKEAANDRRPGKAVTSETLDPIIIEDNWVCCDRCQKWRLLPYGTKPDQLPEKWLCSMLTWLPGMNRCDISEEETKDAFHALYSLPLPQSQNHFQNHVSGTAAGVSSPDSCHFDQSDLNLSSHVPPNPRKKKQESGRTPYAGINGGIVQKSHFTNNIPQEGVKGRSLNDMKEPILKSKSTINSNVEHLSKSGNFPADKIIHRQKEMHAFSGDSKLKKLKTKREADPYGYEIKKKIKPDLALDNGKSWTTEHNGSIDRVGRGLPCKAVVKSIGKHNEKGSSKDVKSVWNGKVVIPAKKLGDHVRVCLRTGSLKMETHDERKLAPKKRKLKDWQENQNYDETPRNNGNHLLESKALLKDCSDGELRKGKKHRVSRAEGKESSTKKDDTGINTKCKVTKILLSGNKGKPVHGGDEFRNIKKAEQPRKHKIKVVSNKPAYDGMDPLRRDLGSEQFSRTATSSSSKVSDSRKSRSQFPEVIGSPVESVSSSPMRTSSLTLIRKSVLGNDAARSDDFPGMASPRKSFDGEANVKSHLSGTTRRGEVSGVFHLESLRFPVLDFQENNDSQEFGGKSKSSVEHPPEFRNGDLTNSDTVKLENPCSDDLHATDHIHNRDRVAMNHYNGTAFFQGKSVKGSSLVSKDMDKTSTFYRDKVKLSASPSEMQALSLKHPLKDEVEPVKEERHVGTRGSDGKDAKRSDPSQVELWDGNLKQGNASYLVPVSTCPNDGILNVVKQHMNASNHHLECSVPNRVVLKDVPSPLRKDGSSNPASNALKEAEDLICVADRLKESEFGFECNEAYFQAALKFLQGASLLEHCKIDSGKHAEMSPVQFYIRSAKLCEDCAHEYEKHKEMAAVALAYKCMEVAYMRIVYCKNSSTNRDRHDLQTSLQMVPRGESPSSSASDVDNLNNQAVVDKIALSKGIGPHTGNCIIVAHNQPNLVRLLDFTKDINSAMEASRKSQTAFASANVILEEAQNKEGIISLKRVVDFSFQDIEELVRLVRHAIGAVSCHGLGGSKD